MFTKKNETGIILLENLKFGDRPMKMLDKTKIMTLEQVKVIFEPIELTRSKKSRSRKKHNWFKPNLTVPYSLLFNPLVLSSGIQKKLYQYLTLAKFD